MKKILVACFSLCALQLFTGCYKDDEYHTQNEIQTNPNVTGFYQANFDFDGTTRSWKDGENSVVANYSGFFDRKVLKRDTTFTVNKDTIVKTTIRFKANYQSVFASLNDKEKLVFTADTITLVDSLGAYATSTTVPDADFTKIFTRDVIPYKSGTTDGMSISFTDKDNIVWTSYAGAQTTSTFSFNTTEKGLLSSSVSYIKGTATFSCLLYNGGNSKTLSGTAKLYFVNSK